MRKLIAVDSFIWTAVHAQIRLAIAIQVESPQPYAALNRLLEDASGYASSPPRDLARQPRVY
jgi:hypothetical protein